LILTGRRVKADEAQRIGLVNAVYPAEELMPKAMELAESIAKNGPAAVRNAKRLIQLAFNGQQASGLESEIQLFGRPSGRRSSVRGCEPSWTSGPPPSPTTKVEQPELDVLVADTGLGSLAVGYLLAARGRTVGVVDRPGQAGTTAVSVVAARRVAPIRELIDVAPVVARRSSLVLQPEGALTAEFASDRLRDADHAVAIVDRDLVAEALIERIRGLGGHVLNGNGSP
jgi:acyl transferase domain-containing protein